MMTPIVRNLMFGLLTLVLLSQIIALPVRAENLPDLSGESENIQTDDDIDGADPAEGETPQPDSPPSEQPPASEVLEPPTPPGGSGTLDDWYDWQQQERIAVDAYAQAEPSVEARELLEQINVGIQGIFTCMLLCISCMGVYLILRIVWPLFKG